MESRSRETTPTKEDLDFIVHDSYRHHEDPDYVPNDKHLVGGKEFKSYLAARRFIGETTYTSKCGDKQGKELDLETS